MPWTGHYGAQIEVASNVDGTLSIALRAQHDISGLSAPHRPPRNVTKLEVDHGGTTGKPPGVLIQVMSVSEILTGYSTSGGKASYSTLTRNNNKKQK